MNYMRAREAVAFILVEVVLFAALFSVHAIMGGTRRHAAQ